MPRTYKTREQWLNEFTRRARKVFKEAGYELPPVRMSVGFTSKGAKSKRIGECWTDACSEDGVHEIFITPQIGDASRIADILTHELCHAAVGVQHGHKKPFVDCMKAVGLIGKPTATVAGPDWHKWADPMLTAMGPLPHAALSTDGSGQKTQTTRMIKCECPDCGFTMRTTAKWLEYCAYIECPDPSCRAPMNIG